jgi:hypothetical protein
VSSSSSSSSWSSESSAWDTGEYQAKSYFIKWDIRVHHNVFIARCSVDLRYRDAVIVEARGPLLIDIGGTFGTEEYPEEIVSCIDEITFQKTWESLDNARDWITTLESRVQAGMAVLRQLYEAFPTDFTERTRTI